MLQRKQTVFLLLAFIAIVVCLALPIGRFLATGEGADYIMYNNTLYATAETDIYIPAMLCSPLAILLLIACPLTLWTIFKYKNLRLQSMLCTSLILLMLLWIAWYVFVAFHRGIADTTFHPALAAALPVIAIILYAMARKGIISDEKLLKAADRIR